MKIDKACSCEKEHSIAALGLNTLVHNCLLRWGVRTVEELAAMTEDEVDNIRFMPVDGYSEIQRALTQFCCSANDEYSNAIDFISCDIEHATFDTLLSANELCDRYLLTPSFFAGLVEISRNHGIYLHSLIKVMPQKILANLNDYCPYDERLTAAILSDLDKWGRDTAKLHRIGQKLVEYK